MTRPSRAKKKEDLMLLSLFSSCRAHILLIIILTGATAVADSSAFDSQRFWVLKITNFFKNPELALYEECIMESVRSWNSGKTNISQERAAQAVNRICLGTLRNLYFSKSYLSQDITDESVVERFLLGDSELPGPIKTEKQLKELLPIYPENRSHKKINPRNATDYYSFLQHEHLRVKRIAESLGF